MVLGVSAMSLRSEFKRADLFSLLVGNSGSNIGMLRTLALIIGFIAAGGISAWGLS